MASRRRSSLLRIGGALFAVAVLVSWTLLPRLFPPGRHLLDRPAPDFTLPVIANGDRGARLRLADLRGRIVVLDFWATWCEPCALQAAIVERVAQRHPDGVVVVGVNVADEPSLARRYVDAKGLSYLIVSDEEGDVQTAYRASTLPCLVVIAADGRVVRHLSGLVSGADLERALRSARETGS